jgi:hypothetical protein
VASWRVVRVIAPDFAAALARWQAWAAPAAPSSMTAEPELHRLRERWPLDGTGPGPRDYAALVAELGWTDPRERANVRGESFRP